MKQRLQRILLLCLFFLVGTTSFAYDFMVDGICYNSTRLTRTVSVTYKTVSYNSYKGIVHIPEKVEYEGITYTVTSIGKSAFEKCNSLTEVTIPNSVTVIDDYAFRECGNLTKITIPSSVISIGIRAFQKCGLTELTIADGVNTLDMSIINYSNVKYDSPFVGCPITDLYLGRNVTHNYSFSPFEENAYIQTLVIGNNVTSIDRSAFLGCSGLAKVTIPNSVTEIGFAAFQGCI